MPCLIAPIQQGLQFLRGKLVSNFIFTVAVGLLLLPLMTLLYNLNLLECLAFSWLYSYRDTLVVCVTGTLLATMALQSRAPAALLSIVQLPVILPDIALHAVISSNGIIG